jgi:hypothetical protein
MVADLNVGGDFPIRSSTFTVVYRTFGDVRTSDEVARLLGEGVVERPSTKAGGSEGLLSYPGLSRALGQDRSPT